jgi:carbonic anhydrase/acetyltransferase-like protein (isoleucine patch superfamily)
MTIYEFDGIRPTLGENVYVAPSAAVIGDVHLGANSSVWFSAVLRGDMYPIRIGARVNVQDGAVVHVTQSFAATQIGDDVTIGHLALVHGCTIGRRCLIGMGAIVLDNVEIGDECIIAAGTLLPPRTKIPARSLVMGNPGKVVREVRDSDLLMVDGGVASYQEYARIFASGRVKAIAE